MFQNGILEARSNLNGVIFRLQSSSVQNWYPVTLFSEFSMVEVEPCRKISSKSFIEKFFGEKVALQIIKIKGFLLQKPISFGLNLHHPVLDLRRRFKCVKKLIFLRIVLKILSKSKNQLANSLHPLCSFAAVV